jgi:valyl-tRNA synthetase
MTDAAGAEFTGLDRFAARKKVLETARRSARCATVSDYANSVGVHGKCDTDHRADDLAAVVREDRAAGEPRIDGVRNGTIQIMPQTWEATYFNWMENIHDWTISRQLWWGHRIPAFYCPNGHMTVRSRTSPRADSAATAMTQETDVLDTWFSPDSGRSRRWAGRTRRRTQDFLSDRHADHRLRHPLLLGSAA